MQNLAEKLFSASSYEVVSSDADYGNLVIDGDLKLIVDQVLADADKELFLMIYEKVEELFASDISKAANPKQFWDLILFVATQTDNKSAKQLALEQGGKAARILADGEEIQGDVTSGNKAYVRARA